MIYKFIDNKGTFTVKDARKYNAYFPLTDKNGKLLSSIGPNLAGDIKKDNDHFVTPPSSIEDIRNNLLCRRDFFIKTKDETIRLSQPYNEIAEYGFLYQKIKKNTKKFVIEVLNFIPHDISVEVMRVSIYNKTNKKISITPTSFIPIYARAEKNIRDHRHVSSLLNRVELDKYGILVKPTMVFDEKSHKINSMIYFVLGYENGAKAPSGQFPTIDYFCGESDLLSPDAIEKNIKPATKKLAEFDGKEACGALRFLKRNIKPRGKIEYFLFIGAEKNPKDIKNIFSKLNSSKKVEEAFVKTRSYWLNYLSSIDFDFKDNTFNNWLRWVKLQPTLRKLFGCSYLPHFDYGKGGRGWRDLWQDALTLLITEPGKAKDLILHNFKGVRIDGSNATVITNTGEFIPDRNRISRVWMDHGVWPYMALNSYIHKNGDLAILLKELPYFKDSQLKRAREIDTRFKQKDTYLRGQNGKIYKGTVIEHILIQTISQFFNVGKHNAIRLENADWNDGLDMASLNGESVAFSFMYAHNLYGIAGLLKQLKPKIKKILLLKELAILLDRLNKPLNYNDFKEKQNRLEEYLEKTKNITGRKITVRTDDLIYDLEEKAKHMHNWLKQHEWLNCGFFNGYYDNKSRRVEGKHNNTADIMLATQVFAIMSGVASDNQIKTTWRSIKKYLYDKKLGGFRLNTDFGKPYIELGRAFGFAYGEKENGAFFSHMTVMLANALYKRGFIKEGFEVINSIYKMASNDRAKIYPSIPEYFNNQGKGLYLYLTGSASWYTYTLLEQTIGLQFHYGDLFIKPKLISQNFSGKTIKIVFILSGKKVEISFYAPSSVNRTYQIESVFLGTEKILKKNGNYIISRRKLLQKPVIKVFLR